jgi:hypothetical protein
VTTTLHILLRRAALAPTHLMAFGIVCLAGHPGTGKGARSGADFGRVSGWPGPPGRADRRSL